MLIGAVVGLALLAAQAQRMHQYLSILGLHEQLTLLGWGTVGLLEVLLPAASFLGVVYVFRHAWRAGYITILWSCGFSPWQLGSGVFRLAVFIVFATALFSHFLGPMALSRLQGDFVQAFESGRVHPIEHLAVGSMGGIKIGAKKGETSGVFEAFGKPTLLHADASQFLAKDNERRLQFTKVLVANSNFSLQTEQLSIRLDSSAFHPYPKVLRGTKLLSSDDLDVEHPTHQYAVLRRCVLALLGGCLVLIGAVMPRLLTDIYLAIGCVVLLAAGHLSLRFIELAQLDGLTLLLSMMSVSSVYLSGVFFSWRRVFWRI